MNPPEILACMLAQGGFFCQHHGADFQVYSRPTRGAGRARQKARKGKIYAEIQ